MNYKISKEKYEIIDNLLKNHRNMTLAEKINHLDFVFNYRLGSEKLEYFFSTYEDPIEAIRLYKQCRFIVEADIKKEKVVHSPNGIYLFSLYMFLFLGIYFISFSFYTLYSQPLMLDFVRNIYVQALFIFCAGIIPIWMTFSIKKEYYLANKFENLKKIAN